MTEACRDKINEICQKLKDAGLVETRTEFQDKDVHRFIDPKRRIETYLGTYLNPFSCIETPGEKLKFLWSDSIAQEYASIEVEALYRHNGADDDANAVIMVYHWHSSVYQLPVSDHDLKNPIFVAEAKKSPTDFLKNGEICCSCSGSCVFKKKVSYLAKTKATDNAVNAAIEAFNTFVPNDHSSFKQKREDYMKPTPRN